MAETKNTTSQTQQTVPGADVFKRMVDEQVKRAGQLFEEAARIQGKWVEFSNQQLEEFSGLARAGVNSANSLMSDWQKLSMESAKKTMELFGR